MLAKCPKRICSPDLNLNMKKNCGGFVQHPLVLALLSTITTMLPHGRLLLAFLANFKGTGMPSKETCKFS
jgi:hypothetical protein